MLACCDVIIHDSASLSCFKFVNTSGPSYVSAILLIKFKTFRSWFTVGSVSFSSEPGGQARVVDGSHFQTLITRILLNKSLPPKRSQIRHILCHKNKQTNVNNNYNTQLVQSWFWKFFLYWWPSIWYHRHQQQRFTRVIQRVVHHKNEDEMIAIYERKDWSF